MQYFRDYHPEEQGLFGYLDPEQILAANDPARFVDDLVERLDLCAFVDRYSALGAPGYDPRLHLKIFLLGYMEGVYSSRRLMKRCQRDIAFIFLTRGQVPNFRTIARFRQLHSDDLKGVFLQILAVAREMGLVRIGRLVIDSTTIKANASRGATLTKEKMDAELAELDEYLRQLGANDQSEEQAGGEEPGSLPAELIDREERQRRIAKALGRRKKLKVIPKPSGEATVNSTDPDCVFRPDGATKQVVPGFGCQAATSEDGLIIEMQVRSESADPLALEPVVEGIKANLKSDLKESELYADTGYYSSGSIHKLNSEGIVTMIPDRETSNRLCGKEVKSPHPGFVYDEATDSYTCPQGANLPFARIDGENDPTRRQRRVYRNTNACRSCPIRESCVGTKFPYKQIRLTGEPGELKKHQRQFESPEKIEKYRRVRKGIEKVFGHIKGNLRMRQFLTRGLRQVSGEWSLVCTAYNILRMWNEKVA